MVSRNRKPYNTPSLSHHKASGQGVVRLNGRDVYCGQFGSDECRSKYHCVIAEWEQNGRRPPDRFPDRSPDQTPENTSAEPEDLTINEMLLAYLTHADSYYVKNGKPTTEPVNIRLALRPLRRLYGDTMAREFGPTRLKAVRQDMVATGLCRNEVNKRVRHILRAFKWAVEEEMVPASVHHGLRAVKGLRRGRSNARESEPVKPVPDTFVDATLPHLNPQVRVMVEIQRLTGMRPGEVCSMRTIDVDTSGRVWIYTPESHKTEHHGRERRIYLGPAAQEILRPWLRPELTAYLFQPREAEAGRRAEQRANRKTPVQPSQQYRRKRRPRRTPGSRYTTGTYRQSIGYGIDKANREAERTGNPPIRRWFPHQLRHSAGTRIRHLFGLDTARAVLGHSSPAVTEVYAELDGAKAAEAMERVG
jgi:integrase